MTHVPDGWRLVPEEPTREMLYHLRQGFKGDLYQIRRKKAWQQMLAAAPTPPASGEEDACPDCGESERATVCIPCNPEMFAQSPSLAEGGAREYRRWSIVNDGPDRWILLDAENDDPAPVYETRDQAEAALAMRDELIPGHKTFVSLAEEVGRLREAAKLAREALTHMVPEDCWATGPNTGNPIEDLVICPGCRANHFIDQALSTSPPPIQERDEAWQGMLAALKKIDALLEAGVLVRDVTKDRMGDWSLRMMELISDLQSVQAAISRAEALK